VVVGYYGRLQLLLLKDLLPQGSVKRQLKLLKKHMSALDATNHSIALIEHSNLSAVIILGQMRKINAKNLFTAAYVVITRLFMSMISILIMELKAFVNVALRTTPTS